MTSAGRRLPNLAAALIAGGRALDGVVVLVGVASVVRTWWQPLEPGVQLTALALLATVPLLARRRFPLAAPLVALVGGCLGLALVVPGALWEQLQFFFCALLCSWILGSENRPRSAVLGLAAAVAVAVVSVATDPVHHHVGDYVFGVAITAAAWGGGVLFGVRARQAATAERRSERLAAEREWRAAEAVAAERDRLARELHDVIAHTVSVMVVQAGAAEHLLGPGHDEVRAALHAVRQSGKGALVELRRMLGLLRDDESAGPPSPQPCLAEVDRLVARLAGTGTAVELSTSGVPRPLSPALDQTSYRIVQEALTNTIKHAGPAAASVGILWEADALVLTVTDDGRGAAGLGDEGGGRGLIGMRERVRLFGGEVTAGPRPEGGFQVTARLPT